MNGHSKAVTFRFQLDMRSGVPVYRQIIDQVLVAVASGACKGGDQLPTVRQVAVDLAINPNTVVRAYRELEIRGILTSQQGTGTFITSATGGPERCGEAASPLATGQRIRGSCGRRRVHAAGSDGPFS